MSQELFYLARAAEARKDAAAAVLDNVRERHLTSEAAWSEMAERAGRTDRARLKVIAEKAAARSAAAEALALETVPAISD
jgi:hypothetical protein